MAESVLGLLEDLDSAQQLRDALVEAGYDRYSVVILGSEAGEEVAAELVERGLEEDRARQYAEAIGRGGVLVAAEVEDARKALAVMKRFDLKAPEELLVRAQSIQEELRVGKETATSGKRLVTNVTEREIEKPVTLREEKVEVERRPTDRRLNPEEADQAFREEVVEMTATSERPVVSKEARVTGEVVLRKRAVERQEVVRDTVRRKDVEVETFREAPTRR